MKKTLSLALAVLLVVLTCATAMAALPTAGELERKYGSQLTNEIIRIRNDLRMYVGDATYSGRCAGLIDWALLNGVSPADVIDGFQEGAASGILSEVVRESLAEALDRLGIDRDTMMDDLIGSLQGFGYLPVDRDDFTDDEILVALLKAERDDNLQ